MHFSTLHYKAKHFLSECINSITFEIMNEKPKLSQRFKKSMMVRTLKELQRKLH